MKCINCNQENFENNKFCSSCGTNLQNIENNIKPEKKKKKRKIILPIIIIILMIIAILIGVHFLTQNKNNENNKETMPEEQDFSRTIMIYMVGSNLESESGLATKDIEEIEDADIDLENTNIIIYAGGTNNWDNDFENNTIYELTEDGFEFVKSDDNTNMGKPETLTDFLDYVYENYEATEYGLILWDHGAGPIFGYGADEKHDNDGLLLSELDEALSDSNFKDQKLEFIGFDACLMSSVEVASILSEYTDYMIASQDLEPGYGWDYSFLEEIDEKTTAEEIGKYAVDYMVDFYGDLEDEYNGLYKFYATLSLLDLTKISNLENALNNLFEDVDVSLVNNGYSKIVSKITKAKTFGYNGYNKSYDLIDLIEVSEQLSESYNTSDLEDAVNDVVIYNKTNVKGANGLSIYYPYYTKSNINRFLEIYDDFDFADKYTKFLHNYSRILTGEKLNTSTVRNLTPQFEENSNTLSVTLDNETTTNYNNSNYIIFRDMKNGYYMPVYKSSDVSLSGNILTANFNKKQLSVTDEKGEHGWVTMFEFERNSEYAIYNIPIILFKNMDSLENYQIRNAYVQLQVDHENPNGKIINIIPMSDIDNTNNAKNIIKLEDWDVIQFFNSEYKLYDANGVYTGEWESSGTNYLTEVTTDEKYKIEFIELDEDYDYYCAFQIDDTQGNIQYTNLIKID